MFTNLGMKKIYSYVLLILLCLPAMSASAIDSIVTEYKNGEFVSQYKTQFKVSNKVIGDVTDYFMTDFHRSPSNLFNWALKGLGLEDKKNAELIFVVKPSSYDEKTGITHGHFDILVPHFTTFKNVKVDAIVSKKTYKTGETKLSADIIYSSLLLKNGVGSITIIPQKDNEQLIIADVRLKFGWFFNIFITQKRYKSIIEWRIKKFTENVKAECERRQANMIHKVKE